MTAFVLAAAALAAAAVLLLLRPWRRRPAGADFTRDLNATIHRDRLAELERDRASGVLSDADFAEARDELERQLLDDTAVADAAPPAAAIGKGPLIALALAVPLTAALIYLWVGTPVALQPEAVRAQQAEAEMAHQVEGLVEQLAAKLAASPDNPEGWAMLARSYKALGRLDDAERAFARVGPLLEQDARLLADLADLLASKQGSFDGRPRELLQKALRVNPDDPMSLWLAGTDAFNQGRYNEAIRHWERLGRQLEPGSEDAQAIEAGLAEARQRAGLPAAKVSPGGTAATPAAASGKAVSGRVELDPALKAKTKPEDVVFIYARAVEGPRMPLAVQRARVADLPLDFRLDDGQAITPELRISSAGELRIEARVSRTGDATPAKGDLSGRSTVVKPGTSGVAVRIDQVD